MEMIDEIIMFLSGKEDKLIEVIEERMKEPLKIWILKALLNIEIR